MARAFAVATGGRPGPVVLALPEDALWAEAAVGDLPRYVRVHQHPGAGDIARMRDAVEAAERPFLLIGGSGWNEASLAQLHGFAERFDLPAGVAWRRLECFNQRHPNFAGHVGWGMTAELRARVRAADLLLAVCTRLGEATTEGYSAIESPRPRQRLIHVYPDASELGRVFHPSQAIAADPVGFAAAVADLQPRQAPKWSAATREAHAQYLDSLEPLPAPGPLSLDRAAHYVNAHLPPDACVTVGAGNYALYPHRYRQFAGLGTSLAPTLGVMGYGLPAAISAKLEYPQRSVVCFAGDGCFQMNMQELGTAMQYRTGIVVLVFNNGMWGTMRAHQEREFPARELALDFDNPHFAQLVTAYRGYGEVVEKDADFGPAFERARAFAEREHLPALLEIRYDPDGIAPGATLSAIRKAALDKRRND
jgi:acetolactate synthase-1/2/3 large subunit